MLRAEIKRIEKASNQPISPKDGDAQQRTRYSAKSLAFQRRRLGLSAEGLGKLIGVSGLSIYKWEAGQARPRERYMPAITALRTLKKRDAAAIVAER